VGGAFLQGGKKFAAQISLLLNCLYFWQKEIGKKDGRINIGKIEFSVTQTKENQNNFFSFFFC